MTTAKRAQRRQAWRRLARLGPRATFDASIAAGAAVALFVDDRSAIVRASGAYADSWLAGLVVGGVLVIVGTMRRRPITRAVGASIVSVSFAAALAGVLTSDYRSPTSVAILFGATVSHAVTALAAWRVGGIAEDDEEPRR